VPRTTPGTPIGSGTGLYIVESTPDPLISRICSLLSIPKFINISVGLTFIESRNTTNRLYDFGTPLSNDTAPKPTNPTGDGNKQNNNNGGGNTGGGGAKPGPVATKDVQKKIKGTNVPDGTNQVKFGGGSFGGGGAGGGF
jgi:hypothetical protein